MEEPDASRDSPAGTAPLLKPMACGTWDPLRQVVRRFASLVHRSAARPYPLLRKLPKQGGDVVGWWSRGMWAARKSNRDAIDDPRAAT